MTEQVGLPPLTADERRLLAHQVGTWGNQLVARAFTWATGSSDDDEFQRILLNSANQFTVWSQVFYNTRLLHGMQQDVVSEAEEMLTQRQDWLAPPPTVTPPPVVPDQPTSEEEKGDPNGPPATN